MADIRMTDPAPPSTFSARTDWLLEGCLPERPGVTRIPLNAFPFRVGRDSGNDLPIPSRNVSKFHASILNSEAAILVEDNGSTNGTFVNGRQILQPTPVGLNDLIQFADSEFRLLQQSSHIAEFTCVAQQPQQNWLISRMTDVINNRRLSIHFQPIICGSSNSVFGYEALVRTDVTGLESPLKLFEAARKLGQEARLSQLCRSEAVRTIEDCQVPGTLFLNTDPGEVLDAALAASMKALRDQAPGRPMVLEVHEQAVPEVQALQTFAEALREIDVQLAFDDFGAGQSRLLELAQVRPDFLKFDRSLVGDLGSPLALQTSLVRTLHDGATSLGIRTLAEGVESPESVAACREIGFQYFQGYAFGRPQPLRR